MEEEQRQKKEKANAYLKYSGLGIQLLLTLCVSGWLGYKLDQYLSIKFPAFMLLFGLAAFVGTIYKLYKSINSD